MKDLLREIAKSRMREAIEKYASFWQNFTRSLTGSNIGKQVGEGLLAAGTAAAVTGLGVAAKAGFERLQEKVEKPRAFKDMMDAAPGLAKQDPKAVQMTFNTLYGMNRQMAKDPLVASSFVGRNVQRAEMGGSASPYVDPQTAKMLIDAGPRGPGPLMEAWKGGPGRVSLPKTGSSSEAEDKLGRFRSQLQQSSGSRGPRAQDPFAPKEDIIRESQEAAARAKSFLKMK